MNKKTSFGKYFDDQRDRIVKDMQNKNKQQNVEWMEAYEKREQLKDYNHRRSIQMPVDSTTMKDSLQNEENWENEGGVSLPYVDDNTPREELDSWTKTTAKATAKGIAAKESSYIDEDTQLFWWESIGT